MQADELLEDMIRDPDRDELLRLVIELVEAYARDVEEQDERALRFFSSPCHTNAALESLLILFGVI